MKVLSRVRVGFVGSALGVVGTVGMAAPAFASYSNDSHVQWEPPGPVQAIAVSGATTFLGGATLDPITGAIDGGYVVATGAQTWTKSTDGEVRALELSADGTRIFVGGNFVTVAGATHKRLASLTASKGDVEPWRASASGVVRDLLVDGNGNDLFVAGAFASLNGNGERGVGKISTATGKNDPTFHARTDNPVYGLAKSGSNLILAGQFTSVNTVSRPTLAAVDRTTGNLMPWAPASLCSGCNKYWDVTVDATRAYVASGGKGGNGFGAFDLTSGARAYYFHTDGDVQAVALSPTDNLLYIGGHFNRYVGADVPANERHLIAAVDRNSGLLDPNFKPRFYKSYPGVWALVATANTLYAGGYFEGVFNNGGTTNNHEKYFAMFGPSS